MMQGSHYTFLFVAYILIEEVGSFKLYEKLIRDHKNEVSSKIDLDNAREILQFFKDKNILNEFKRTALLKITIYGKAEYIKETVYPEIMADPSKDIFFEDDLASVWIKEKGKNNQESTQEQPKNNQHHHRYKMYDERCMMGGWLLQGE